MKLTKETLMAMSLEELCALRSREEIEAYTDGTRGGMRVGDDELNNHLNEMLEPLCRPYVVAIRKGFAARKDITELATQLGNEPPLVRLQVWGLVTSGVDEMDLAKYAHKYLVRCILNVFGVAVPNT